ncbi:MAG: porin [Rhizomicrobium sp.]|nr:porin [Rhizomicrobium sp.]
MKGKSALLAGVAAIALIASAQAGYAAKKTSDATSDTPATTAATPAGPTNAELAARIQALEDALQTDESKAQGEHTRLSTLEQNFNYTTWTFDNGRPVVNSGDGRFSMAFRVRFQADYASFLQDDPRAATNTAQFKDLSNGAAVRRAFFGVEGKAFNDFWYEFRYNGGGGGGAEAGDPLVSIARVAYTGIPHFRINLGVIEPALMLEGTTSSGQLMFLERPEIENIALDSFGAADARRGIEVAFQYDNMVLPGDNFIWTAAYTGAKTTAAGASATGHGNGGDEQSQFLSHLSYRFWSDGASNALVGFDYSTALFTGGTVTSIAFQDRPEIRVDGTRLIGATLGTNESLGCKNATSGFISCHATMLSAHAAGNIENFYLGAEYTNFRDDRYNATTLVFDHPQFSGYMVEGSWILTGETKGYSVNATNNEIGGYGSPKVASPFSLAGDSWGAFELVARYSFTNLDWNRGTATYGVAGGREGIVDLGLNWYLNNEVKIQLHDSIVHVNKLNAAAGVTQIGQDLNIVGIRLQFSN